MFDLKLGCHLSSAKGYLAMGKTAVKIGANTFSFFTRNPRGGAAKALDPADASAFCAYAEEYGISHLVAHAPYTLNPCSSDAGLREFARNTMRDDLFRMEHTPKNYYNFHPGCHTGQGSAVGIRQVAELLNDILTPEMTTTVLIETMSGKGTEIGKSFEELAEMLSLIALSDKVGVCLDTCHVWDAGYDILDDLDGVLSEFDRIIGLEKLLAIHLNDSLNPLGAKKDRHAMIGEGHIGKDALLRVLTHPALSSLPFILETPTDDLGHGEEIAMLRASLI